MKSSDQSLIKQEFIINARTVTNVKMLMLKTL